MKVHAQAKARCRELMPVMIAVVVAVVGAAGILDSMRPASNSHDGGNARMITSAALSKVGAIEIPSAPPTGRQQGVPT
jgi:hypothetical protein